MKGALTRLLPQERGAIDVASTDTIAIRNAVQSAIASGVWQTSPPPVVQEIAGIRALRFGPVGKSRATILHLHGGGFRIGCPDSVSSYANALAQHCEVEVVASHYRLAPENPFPAGLTDSASVLEDLYASGETSVILSGDSAGGGLAASLVALCVRAGLPLAGAILHSPWLDLTVSAPSYHANSDHDPLFSLAAAAEASHLYLGDHDRRDPLVSPLFADLHGYPPTLITVGTGEVLWDDSRSFHARLKAAEVDTRLLEVAGMDHVAITRGLALSGAAEVFTATAAFIEHVLA